MWLVTLMSILMKSMSDMKQACKLLFLVEIPWWEQDSRICSCKNVEVSNSLFMKNESQLNTRVWWNCTYSCLGQFGWAYCRTISVIVGFRCHHPLELSTMPPTSADTHQNNMIAILTAIFVSGVGRPSNLLQWTWRHRKPAICFGTMILSVTESEKH